MRFKENYAFLSNMTFVDITFRGITYRSVENMYQAFKTADVAEHRKISRMNPYESKRYGRTLVIRDDWDTIKDRVMWEALCRKFSQPHFRQALSHVSEPIVEDNYWGDTYWGVCKGVGANKLGRMLQHLRDNPKQN